MWQKGPGPKPTPNKQIYWQTSQGLNSQDHELLSGSNQMSGPRWHDRGWDPRWTEGSGCGWGEPSDIEGGEGDPHQHSFLDLRFPGTPKGDHGWLSKGEVALFVPNPMRCFNCSKFGHMSQRCKVAAKCTGCGKDKHEGQCEDPSCALIAMVPTLHRLKIARSGRRRRRFKCPRWETHILSGSQTVDWSQHANCDHWR